MNWSALIMSLIWDGNSEKGAQVRSEISNLICYLLWPKCYLLIKLLGYQEVTANIWCFNATFPSKIRKITVQVFGHFWVTQRCITCHPPFSFLLSFFITKDPFFARIWMHFGDERFCIFKGRVYQISLVFYTGATWSKLPYNISTMEL